MILAKYYTTTAAVTNITPCVNMADGANYVKLSLKAQLKEKRNQREPSTIQSLRAF